MVFPPRSTIRNVKLITVVHELKMKATILLGQMLAFLMMGTASALAQKVDLHWTSPVKERYVTFYAEPQGKPPEEMTYLIQPANPDPKFQAEWETEAQTNHNLMPKNRDMDMEIFNDFNKAVWVPFKTNLLVDFGPGDGGRWLWVNFRMKGDEKPQSRGNGGNDYEMGGNWNSHHIILQSLPPTIVITNPKERVTSQPMIQLQGATSSDLGKPLSYQVFDQNGAMTANGNALVNDTYRDPILLAFTTNYFTCYDLDLNPGTNTIVLRGEDQAGFSFTNNFVIVYTTAGDTNPPALSVDFPPDNDSISGSDFKVLGVSDDPTADIVALMVNPAGEASERNALVERNGRFWVEHIPLAEGRTYITLVANDAAGNTSITNFSIRKSHYQFAMNPVPDDKLWNHTVTATGTASLIYTNYDITVNGAKAVMDSSGKWKAEKVPMTEGGVAIFDIQVNPRNGQDESKEPDPYPTEPILWDSASNQVQQGIYCLPCGTNQFNHYGLMLYLVNPSNTNMNFVWMRPKQPYLFSLRLYDSAGKEVATKDSIKNSSQPLPDGLNLHHLGKNELSYIDGVLPLFSNAPVRLTAVRLDECLRLPPPGDYRLEVTERMFKIVADGRLVPVEFPPISTPIKIIDQPSEMVFYLNDLERQGKLTWGAESNGLRIGVAHGMKFTRIQDANQIEVFLQNTSTNDYRNWNLRFPSPNEQFDVTLYDASGKEVPKTALGKQQGQPLSLDSQIPRKAPSLMDKIKGLLGGSNVRPGRMLRPVFVSAKDATDCGRFNLNDYFEIKIPGKYRLTYQQRFYRSNTNSMFTGVIMPMVNVPLDITNIPGQ